ncbi:hypothetical protein CF081_20115, partial [Clostridium botulinum]
VKENALRAYENQDYQFEELVDKLNIIRDMSRNPLFDVMFTMQNMDIEDIENIAIDDLKFELYDTYNNISKFDLTLSAIEIEEEILLSIEYNTRLYKRETIEKMINHFSRILSNLSKDIYIKIDEIEIIEEEEKNQILYEFNDTKVEYPKDKAIQELFEEQVEKTPNNIAVVFEDKKLTYRELNEKANSLARVLRDKGVKADSIVGIMVERSIEMIVGIMGILKSGGAYLPIDPSYPVERIEYMIEDAKIDILITSEEFINKVKFTKSIVNIKEKSLLKKDNLDIINKSSDLAYVIYTSGSTGRPKGVMVEHKSLINL